MSSYPNLTPNLGKLNFQDIKDSLKAYLKNQDSLKDFNFEGSVMQTLLNVLAYNTYYYAFYSNMMASEGYLDSAQRLDSVISLTKPLGYFVPLKTASRAVINVTGLTDDIPQYAEFRGVNEDGVIYSFYTLKSYPNIDSAALGVEIFEAKKIYTDLEVTPSFDPIKQRFFISDPNFDANTLTVKVQLDGQNNSSNTKDVWTLADNFGSTSVANQNVYYLERANNGVYVLFGKINSLGKQIDDSRDRIYIDYFSVNGSVSNDIYAFSIVDASIGNNINIGLVSRSKDGTDEPNLDLIKFAAPKTFGAQNRAVTKDDIKGLIADFFESPNQFNVFGGEEIFPQMFGRVFFTADLNPNNEDDAEKIQRIYDLLKDKCVVTVIPEFTVPKSFTINNDVTFSLATNRSSFSPLDEQTIKNGIKNILNTYYDTDGSYNFYFDSSEAVARIKDSYEDVVIEQSDFNLYYQETFASSGKLTINLENEFEIPLFTDFEITGEFLNKQNQTIKLAAYVIPAQNKFDFINLKTLIKNSSGAFVSSPTINGRINIKKGIIEIYDVRKTGASITISIPFKNSYFRTKLDSKVKFTTNSVELR
jgi:hypothetical protein